MNLWIFNHYAIMPDLPGGTWHYDLLKSLVNEPWTLGNDLRLELWHSVVSEIEAIF